MRNRTRWLLITLLVVCLLALASLGVISARIKAAGISNTEPEVAHGVTHVFIHYEAFQPGAIQVPVGTTVTWTNQDNVFHTVTISNAMVSSEYPSASGQLSPGASFSYTFLSRGTFSYYCSDHPSAMRGKVIVN